VDKLIEWRQIFFFSPFPHFSGDIEKGRLFLPPVPWRLVSSLLLRRMGADMPVNVAIFFFSPPFLARERWVYAPFFPFFLLLRREWPTHRLVLLFPSYFTQGLETF